MRRRSSSITQSGPARRACADRAHVVRVALILLIFAVSAGTARAGATGACCFDDGLCLVVDGALECLQFGGDYQGNGTTCADVDCGPPPPPPTGACCFFDGSCAILTQSACLNGSGLNWGGGGSTCATLECTERGACCYECGCYMTTESGCLSLGDTYLGDASDCATNPCPPPIGACCLGVQCDLIPESDCVTAGGTWVFCTSCPDAVCVPCLADIIGPNGPDGNVDALDSLLLLQQWGSPCAGTCDADITGPAGVPDGNVDALDFLLLLEQWGSPANCG